MKSNKVVRIVLGLIVLVLFGVYSYLKVANSPQTRDVGAAAAPPAVQETVEPTEESAPPSPELTPTPSPEPSSDLPQVDLSSWELMLVNSDNPLDENYAPPEISYLSDSQCPVDSRIAEALTAFADAAKAEGLPVYLSSGFRAYSEQSYLYNRKIGQGYSAEEAATIVALPGTSEHQTGLVCDITDYYREFKDSSLENTETYKWMSEHCHEYGFIVRFPNDKKDITKIIYEPWHFRYVGVEVATYIMENDLCLEEFIALYDEA